MVVGELNKYEARKPLKVNATKASKLYAAQLSNTQLGDFVDEERTEIVESYELVVEEKNKTFE